jgi:hypothetical protein
LTPKGRPGPPSVAFQQVDRAPPIRLVSPGVRGYIVLGLARFRARRQRAISFASAANLACMVRRLETGDQGAGRRRVSGETRDFSSRRVKKVKPGLGLEPRISTCYLFNRKVTPYHWANPADCCSPPHTHIQPGKLPSPPSQRCQKFARLRRTLSSSFCSATCLFFLFPLIGNSPHGFTLHPDRFPYATGFIVLSALSYLDQDRYIESAFTRYIPSHETSIYR